MPKYALSYYGEPKFQDPEAGAAYKGRWMDWMQEVGEAWVDPGSPFGNARIVSVDGVTDDASPSRLTGFSILEAEDLGSAVELAKRCPHLDHGTVHVAEAMEMGM